MMIEDLVVATESGETSVLPKTAKEKATQLPKPSGYHILLSLIESEEKFDSGIIKSDETRKFEEVLATVFFVVALGPDCYKDKKSSQLVLGVRRVILFSLALTLEQD